MEEDEVVVEDFGYGHRFVGKRLPGESDRDVRMRYARRELAIEEEKRQRELDRRKFFDALRRWKPEKGALYEP